MCKHRKGDRKNRKDNNTTQCHYNNKKARKKTELICLATAQKKE